MRSPILMPHRLSLVRILAFYLCGWQAQLEPNEGLPQFPLYVFLSILVLTSLLVKTLVAQAGFLLVIGSEELEGICSLHLS